MWETVGCADNKMVGQIAKELMYHIIQEKPFNQDLPAVLASGAMSDIEFNASSFAKHYLLDQSKTFVNGVRNARV